jgi:RimJ/RimL family protein N-acetyltransferase
LAAGSITFSQFSAAHGVGLVCQPSQVDGRGIHDWSIEQWRPVEQASRVAWSAFRCGRCVACGGVYEYWRGRGGAWLVIGNDVKGAAMVSIHRKVQAAIFDAHTSMGMVRIETAVRCDFAAGVRWIEMLGFRQEGVFRRYSPDGADHFAYARILET